MTKRGKLHHADGLKKRMKTKWRLPRDKGGEWTVITVMLKWERF